MSKKTENLNTVSGRLSVASRENNLEAVNNVDTEIKDTRLVTRRNIIKTLGFTATGAILYETLDKFFTINSMTIEELPPDHTEPNPYNDFDSLSPNNQTEEKELPEGTPLPAEIDSGVIPTQTIQNHTPPTQVDNCRSISLYKPSGRINLQTLRDLMKD